MPKVGQIEFLSEYMKMFSLEYKIIILFLVLGKMV